ncbi:transcriptional regulator [Arthrobacter echini]|uniref:Transcriptional regulator n=1 Tax=Arthrobacter echini TaxID=1529066 RepID=A0A4S5EAI6_9MICC|nr:ATP-binding protein [Arthrobacter echini]THJ68757.1 transcriptional regulator [Arthrobacter echini]
MSTVPLDQVLEAISGGETADSQESPTLDFKIIGRSIKDTLTDLAEAAACFANSHGGSLVVGVQDRVRGDDAFLGSTLEAIQTVSRIYELTDPGLIVTVNSLEFRGVNLTVISVPQSPDIHQVRGRATERVGTSCEPMSASRIAQVQLDRRGDDWSSKDSGNGVDAVSPVAMEVARDLLKQSQDPERRSWSELLWPDLCRRLGVLTPAGQLTNGGAMLFIDDGRIHVQYTRRVPRPGLLAANDHISGSGVWVIRRVLELIEGRIERTAIVTPSGAQLLIGDLPESAVREAIVNAFMHRDYRSSDPIRVEHGSSRLRITSPGGFVPGVTVDNVLTVSSRSRNGSLAHAIRGLGLGESAGVGVDRMYSAMTAVGHEPPGFTTDGRSVEITLQGGAPNEPLTRFVASLPEDRRDDPDTLLVLTFLLQHRTTTARKMASLVQKNEAEVEAVLLHLSAPGQALVERTADTARSRRGEYRLVGEALRSLGSAVTYRARSGDDTDRKIVEMVREVGKITGRMVQTMFDVQPATASRILSDLVDRRILDKTSKATRGPSVTYGPGKSFPKSRRSNRSSPAPDEAEVSARAELDLDAP